MRWSCVPAQVSCPLLAKFPSRRARRKTSRRSKRCSQRFDPGRLPWTIRRCSLSESLYCRTATAQLASLSESTLPRLPNRMIRDGRRSAAQFNSTSGEGHDMQMAEVHIPASHQRLTSRLPGPILGAVCHRWRRWRFSPGRYGFLAVHPRRARSATPWSASKAYCAQNADVRS